jgi:hypothetical protein
MKSNFFLAIIAIVMSQVSWSFTSGTSVRVTGWYDSELNNNKFYGAIGISQKLPKNCSINLDVMCKEGVTSILPCFGIQF